MADQTAPRFKTDRSSDEAVALTAPSGTNLRTITLRPQFSPQRLTVITTTAPGSITLTPDVGPNLVFAALPLGVLEIKVPCRAVVGASANVTLLCEWWSAPGPDDFQHGGFTRNA